QCCLRPHDVVQVGSRVFSLSVITTRTSSPVADERIDGGRVPRRARHSEYGGRVQPRRKREVAGIELPTQLFSRGGRQLVTRGIEALEQVVGHCFSSSRTIRMLAGLSLDVTTLPSHDSKALAASSRV